MHPLFFAIALLLGWLAPDIVAYFRSLPPSARFFQLLFLALYLAIMTGVILSP